MTNLSGVVGLVWLRGTALPHADLCIGCQSFAGGAGRLRFVIPSPEDQLLDATIKSFWLITRLYYDLELPQAFRRAQRCGCL
jgi:hypothetical protein